LEFTRLSGISADLLTLASEIESFHRLEQWLTCALFESDSKRRQIFNGAYDDCVSTSDYVSIRLAQNRASNFLIL